jgi:acetyl esterase/lipase
MTISLRSRFWRFFLRRMFKDKRMSIEENRIYSLNAARRMNSIPNGVEMKCFDMDGIPSAWIVPAAEDGGGSRNAVGDGGGRRKDKVILHLHGGGYVLGSIEGHQMLGILMAQTLKMKVLLLEYRLAPENPFPAAVDDALKVYRWLLAQGYQAKDIVVSGDSAGGGLSLAMVLSLRDAGEPLPAAVVCLSPWVDLTFKGKSYITKEQVEPILREDVLRMWAEAYCGAENASHPLISPIYGNFRGFPPLLIQVGADEILLDDSIMLAEKAKADGVEVMLKVWNGLWHVWQALGGLIPESKAAFEEMARFVNAHTEM